MSRSWGVALLSVAGFGFLACSGAGSAAPPGAAGPEVDASQSASEPPVDGPRDGGGADATTKPAGGPSAGCGHAAPGTGLSSKTTKANGVSRRYQMFVPAAYDASKPMRLVFLFHGLGGDGDQIRSYFGFESEAAGQALFVYPDGLAQAQQGGATAWALDDVNFFDTMVSEIGAAYCVDTARIFAAGHSFGAYMSNLVGCERGDVVRAIAPVSGGLVAGTCKGAVAAWIAHGDKDSTVAQSEGIGARDHWLTANGCAKTNRPVAPSPCVAYDGCSAGHPVTWCSFPGGHYPLPAYTQQAIWDFFKVL